MQHLVAVLLRGVVATCSGNGFLSDKKALYELYMSQVSNNFPRRVSLLYREISECAIDLVDSA